MFQNKQQNFRKLKKIISKILISADLQIVLALESEGISAISCNGAGVRNSGNCSLASCRRQLQLQLHFLGTRTHSYSYTRTGIGVYTYGISRHARYVPFQCMPAMLCLRLAYPRQATASGRDFLCHDFLLRSTPRN